MADAAPGHAVVDLAGELDLAVAPQLRELFDALAAEAPDVAIVDVADVSFIDSTVLRELLRLHGTVAAGGGRMVVAGAAPGVQRLLQLTGTQEVFDLAGSRAEAVGPA